MRIHAEQLHGPWTAWPADHPETGFGGATPAQAVSRLVEATHGLYVDDVAADHAELHSGPSRVRVRPAVS